MAKPTTLYQLKVTLKGVRPPIWRRLHVPADIKLDKLHLVLQDALGWTNSHLHQFVVGERYIGMMDVDEPSDDLEDEKRFKLSQIAGEKSRFLYEYDFGDGWAHGIVVEKVLPTVDGIRYPICIAGKRACPPEDCGGPYGYADFLDAISDPKHDRHEEVIEWIGRPFDPEEFDVEQTTALIRSGRSRQLGWVLA